MRKFAIVASLFGTYFLILVYIYWWGRVPPNITLESGLNLSRLTREQVHKLVDEIIAKDNVVLKVGDKELVASFADLGITVDHETLEKTFFASSPPKEAIHLAKEIVVSPWRTSVNLPLEIVKDIVIIPVPGESNSPLVYSPSAGKFVYDPPRHDYQIDPYVLMPQIASQFGSASPVLNIEPRVVAHRERQVDDLNNRLARASAKEMIVRVKDGRTYGDIPIYQSEIREMLTFSQKGDIPLIDVDRSLFESLVSSRLTDSQKKEFQIDVAYPNAVATLSERFSLQDVDLVVLGIDDGPTSDGTLADRYIEVDLSQQKMYFFEKGKVLHDFRVSTGYDYPTPVGEYQILNKAPKAFSDIYDVWMDYWMGFKYAGNIDAYLGIHEIAYSFNDKGQRFYRLGNYIGEPKTGGCVALHPGDASVVYSLSYPGMLMRVVE